MIPTQGNKWEVQTVETNNTTMLEIVGVKDTSVTKIMKGSNFETSVTINYIVTNGVCYIESIESYDILSKSKYHFNDKFSPPIRCEIDTSEMPFYEKYTKITYDFNTHSESIKKINSTHHYKGTEEVLTPAGVYKVKKIEIDNSKMNRLLWRNDENTLIKHQVKYKDEGETTVTVLLNGTSQ